MIITLDKTKNSNKLINNLWSVLNKDNSNVLIYDKTNSIEIKNAEFNVSIYNELDLLINDFDSDSENLIIHIEVDSEINESEMNKLFGITNSIVVFHIEKNHCEYFRLREREIEEI